MAVFENRQPITVAKFSPLLVFVLMDYSQAITNNTAYCFYFLRSRLTPLPFAHVGI
jgi:hypothetical protein